MDRRSIIKATTGLTALVAVGIRDANGDKL